MEWRNEHWSSKTLPGTLAIIHVTEYGINLHSMWLWWSHFTAALLSLPVSTTQKTFSLLLTRHEPADWGIPHTLKKTLKRPNVALKTTTEDQKHGWTKIQEVSVCSDNWKQTPSVLSCLLNIFNFICNRITLEFYLMKCTLKSLQLSDKQCQDQGEKTEKTEKNGEV